MCSSDLEWLRKHSTLMNEYDWLCIGTLATIHNLSCLLEGLPHDTEENIKKRKDHWKINPGSAPDMGSLVSEDEVTAKMRLRLGKVFHLMFHGASFVNIIAEEFDDSVPALCKYVFRSVAGIDWEIETMRTVLRKCPLAAREDPKQDSFNLLYYVDEKTVITRRALEFNVKSGADGQSGQLLEPPPRSGQQKIGRAHV